MGFMSRREAHPVSTTLVLAGVASLAVAACEPQPGAAHAPGDGAADAAGCPEASVVDGSQPLFQNECGGTASATGTSPAGTFSAGKVFTDYHCGTILVVLYDAGGYASLTLSFPYAGGAIGERSATAMFQGPPRGGALVQTAASITLTALGDPSQGQDAGSSGWGAIEGHFSVVSSCLSIAGSFSSAYCSYDSLCG
ncbi:MAG TPA: hypothetical protein VIF57_19730 [Polyangia bacterium]|jgi:hypothetical protein